MGGGRRGKREVLTEFVWRKLKETTSNTCAVRIILKVELQEKSWKAWSGSTWIRIGSVAVHFEPGYEHSVPVKCVGFLGLLRNLQVLKKIRTA